MYTLEDFTAHDIQHLHSIWEALDYSDDNESEIVMTSKGYVEIDSFGEVWSFGVARGNILEARGWLELI